MALLKLRQKDVTRLSGIPKDPFRCILLYCEITEWENGRVTDHYMYTAKHQLNYSWPEETSYHNPMAVVKSDGLVEFVFKLKSGEKTDNTASEVDFKKLNWAKITSLEIRFDSDDSLVWGFVFYNSANKEIFEIG